MQNDERLSNPLLLDHFHWTYDDIMVLGLYTTFLFMMRKNWKVQNWCRLLCVETKYKVKIKSLGTIRLLVCKYIFFIFNYNVLMFLYVQSISCCFVYNNTLHLYPWNYSLFHNIRVVCNLALLCFYFTPNFT